MELRESTEIVLLIAGLIFLLALGLGIPKYKQMATSETHLAHPYIDTAHRAALLYSFATLLIAVFVELSGWGELVNLIAAGALIFFFLAAISTYMFHGFRRDTTNQFADPYPNQASVHVFMISLIVAEMVGFAVLLAGFAQAQIY